MSWCSASAARAPRAVALLLTFDDVGDEPQVLIDPADLEPAVLVRVAPIRDLRPVLDHQVEEVAAHLDGDPRVGGDFALDLDLRHLQPKLLDVAPRGGGDSALALALRHLQPNLLDAPAPLQPPPHDQLELFERGDLVEEAAHRLLDELRGVLRSHVRTLAPRGRPADLPTNAPRAAAETSGHAPAGPCWPRPGRGRPRLRLRPYPRALAARRAELRRRAFTWPPRSDPMAL